MAAFCLLVCLSLAALAALGAELALAYHTPTLAAGDWETEVNAALVTHFYEEVWNGGRLTSVERFVTDDHTFHDRAASAGPTGPSGVAQVVAGFRHAFPDLTLSLDDVVAHGDRVVIRFTAHGTHRGSILGAEGTDRAVEFIGVAVHRIDDRQIAETWVQWDTFGVAQQIGLVLLPISSLGEWEGAPEQDQPGKPY